MGRAEGPVTAARRPAGPAEPSPGAALLLGGAAGPWGGTDWIQIGKGVHQGYLLSLCLFNFYVEYIMPNAVLDEAQAGIKIARKKYQ